MIYQRQGVGGGDVMFNDVMIRKTGPDSKENASNSENLGDQTIERHPRDGNTNHERHPCWKNGK